MAFLKLCWALIFIITNDKGDITKLRVCLDRRDLTEWIKREHYHTKTIDEVVSELNDATFFTVVDTKKGWGTGMFLLMKRVPI